MPEGRFLRFKLQTEYALRAMLYMAAKQGENCTTEEIAGYFRISAAHLGRVIRRLQSHGYVKAIRGRKGGVRLDREPGLVTLGEVVDVLESESTGDGEGSQMHDPERLEAVLRRAEGLFLNYLKQVDFGELGAEGLPSHDREIVRPLAPEAVGAAEPEERMVRPSPQPVLVGFPGSSPGTGR